ncbi:MAG TPA: hypothetical protein H9862_02220 [Candidatus Akkermansia intestinigallinarum]|uniref:Uncharacterized protein n=1 Tax=Candidatus Akkermansia intestinigallinarum TaxID=2838431 RepID=A0A9D2AGT3_9BACT|nr:hypothetical protein [Candidatus Akkermansia intestinigallinarum]
MSLKWIITSAAGVVIVVGAWSIFYPERSAKTLASVEATGAVAVDRLISAMEERVGKTDVALEHYKTALAAKRKALIDLKALKLDTERKANDLAVKIEGIKAAGDTQALAIKGKEKKTYDEMLVSLTERIDRQEAAYKEFTLFVRNKKVELDSLKAQATALRSELKAMQGGESDYALKRAQELEEEVRSTCSRLEAEMDITKLDEELQ